jgi:hypothetical protein
LILPFLPSISHWYCHCPGKCPPGSGNHLAS